MCNLSLTKTSVFKIIHLVLVALQTVSLHRKQCKYSSNKLCSKINSNITALALSRYEASKPFLN